VPPKVVAELQQALDAYPAQGGSFSNWPLQLLVTVDEARERLNREVVAAFGVPPASLADLFTRKACPECGMEFGGTAQAISVSLQAHREGGQCEQRRRKQAPAAPVITEYCTCGYSLTGTPAWIRKALDTHHTSGECPHSAKGR